MVSTFRLRPFLLLKPVVHWRTVVADAGFSRSAFTVGEAILDSITIFVLIIAAIVCRAYVLDKRAPSTVEEEKKLK